MKKTKNNLLTALILLLTVSCENNGAVEIHNDGSGSPSFNFFEKVSIIEVDENVKSFELGGVFSKEPPSYMDNNFPAKLDEERTTTKHKVHFINNISAKYDRKDGLKVYQTIKLIPENIKEEVQIVYYVRNSISGSIKGDSTIIRLIPKTTTP